MEIIKRPDSILFIFTVLIMLPNYVFASSGIEKKEFGMLADGRTVYEYTMTNKNGMQVKVMDFGATVTSIKTPDRNGKTDEVTLGYDTLQDYFTDRPLSYFGVIVGRYANRIAKGRFELNGKKYALATNNGPNHLHGGVEGFNKKLWIYDGSDGNSAVFKLVSDDGDQGYPGKLTVHVIYTLTDNDELVIDYRAATTEPTIVALSFHPYFNLKDAGKTPVLNEQLKIFSDLYLPVDSTRIPTGEMLKVDSTPFDFKKPKTLGKDIHADDEQLKIAGGGYDHCWIIKGLYGPSTRPRPFLELYDPDSGRVLTLLSTEPALQIYTGNYMEGIPGRNGIAYSKHCGLVLEAEHLPDSPNEPIFPSVVLRPGERYQQTTIYKFSVRK